MKYEVKSYNFFKVNGGYETISNGQHCRSPLKCSSA